MLNFPIIGLAPIDGVTDVVFRQIVDECSRPDILYTEFVPVNGLILGKPVITKMLLRHQTKTPIFAQLLGNEPDNFYKATIIALEAGFDGIDINMGCPDNNIVKRGSGAALILQPKLAQAIIKTVKKAVADWGKKKAFVSVKTRIGFNKPIIKEWIGSLLETELDIITLHARSYSERYSGHAHWEEIAKAGAIVRGTKTKFFGNGDIKSLDEAKKKIKDYQIDGVLIGRAAFGNPWMFGGHSPSFAERIQILYRHCQLFNQYFPNGDFRSLRKHFVWYVKSLPHAADLKNRLMKTECLDDVKKILEYSGDDEIADKIGNGSDA